MPLLKTFPRQKGQPFVEKNKIHNVGIFFVITEAHCAVSPRALQFYIYIFFNILYERLQN